MGAETVTTTIAKALGRPAFIYGTAWKKTETTRLVQEALSAGFTAVDTAAQPKHYREDLVGKALRASFEAGSISRDRLFVRAMIAREIHHEDLRLDTGSLTAMNSCRQSSHRSGAKPS